MNDRRQKSVERTLARLGVEEVVERLEISPLMATGEPEPEDPDGGCCSCVCKWTPITLPGSR